MSLTMVDGFTHNWFVRKPSWSRTSKRLWISLYRHLKRASRRAALRRARRELLDLPDFMLADIGISRSEVDFMVRYGRSDPTRLLRGGI